MRRSELIVGLQSLRYDCEQFLPEMKYELEIIEEALYTLLDLDT